MQDPLADGPVIQSASTRALDGGSTLDKALTMLAAVSPEISAPVVMFTYYNPIMARGPDEFCRQAREAGASGVPAPFPLPPPPSPRRSSPGWRLLPCFPASPAQSKQVDSITFSKTQGTGF